jgi:CheY-like chemotaxis protein
MELLLIDDEASLRRTVRITLESMGHQVAEAATTEQALARLRHGCASSASTWSCSISALVGRVDWTCCPSCSAKRPASAWW